MHKVIRRTMIAGICLFLLSACGDSLPEEGSLPTVTTSVEETLAQVTTEAPEPTSQAQTETTVAETTTEAPTTVAEPEPIDYEGLGVNELGHIMVVMYHGIKDNPPYHRTAENFLKDMTFMYEHGYRLISMSDYVSGTIDVPTGTTPIVFTFDDGLPSTFSFIETDEGYAVNPDSAIGLMEGFAQEHPEFGKEASLYIHGSDWNFRDVGTGIERMEWLIENGYEIGNHSNTHENFSKLGETALIKEIGKVEVYVDSVLPGYELFALTYPYGARPQENLRDVLVTASYEGYDFDYKVAFREGPSAKFYPQTHIKATPLSTPRVRGSEGEVQDLWWFLEYYEDHPEYKYISDGDPSTIVVPEGDQEFIKEEALEMFEVITY